jgi:hypothetical protein
MRVDTDINSTLEERHSTYGTFSEVAAASYSIKATFGMTKNYKHNLKPSQKESLDMIASKIARILTGDPNHVDSWHDIAGYATLIADELRGNSR